MADNRENYKYIKWQIGKAQDRDTFVSSRVRDLSLMDDDIQSKKCYTVTSGFVYCFGSAEECVKAVDRHNTKLGLKDLLLDR
jgi:hypothetical protein